MCDSLGRQFSYICPKNTLFLQRMLICDHWYMVNCSKSEEDYTANLLIGQRDKKFVEDKALYRRTPRPDLLSRNISEDQFRPAAGTVLLRNLVGQSFQQAENSESSTSAGIAYYSVPSHWSTKYADKLAQTIGNKNNIVTTGLLSTYIEIIFISTVGNHSSLKIVSAKVFKI